jgi:hypothetical protein
MSDDVPTGSTSLPTIYGHCERIYARMKEQAETVYEGEVPMLVWEGYFTHLFKALNLPTPYFTHCRTTLLNMGCIKQLRRGGGSAPSQWELLKPPTPELFTEAGLDARRQTPGNTVSRGEFAALQQQVRDLADKLDSVEGDQKTLVSIYNEHLAGKSA